MRYNTYEFNKMGAELSEIDDRREAERKRKTVCKNEGGDVHPWDLTCLRCGAAQGESCR